MHYHLLTIHVEFYGRLVQIAGVSQLNLQVPSPSTVSEILNTLIQYKPEIQANLARCACAIGDVLVKRDEQIEHDVTIALIPPVAGG